MLSAIIRLDQCVSPCGLVLMVLCVGIVLRIFSNKDHALIIDNKPEDHGQLFIENEITKSYTALILDFYNNLDFGNYDKAFDHSIEVVWEKDIYFDKNKNVKDNKVIGIKEKKDLINRTIKELGKNGEKLSIFDTNVLNVKYINLEQEGKYLQDVEVARKVSKFKEIDNIYIASVQGEIYSSFCSHSKWQKDLVLIKFKGSNKSTILLSGAKNIVGNCSIEWFINRIVGDYIKI